LREGERLRATEIDALSTLGTTVVQAVLNETSVLDDWSDQQRDDVAHFAALRSAGCTRVMRAFPGLFLGKNILDDEPAQEPSSIAQRLLAGTVERHEGMLPILITAPHNGVLKSLGTIALPQSRSSVAPDGATSNISRDIHTFLAQDGAPTPTVLIDRIHRMHRTPETRAFFEEQTMRAICELRERFDARPILHIDVHGYAGNEHTDQFDLVLGTGHRHTIGKLDADMQLAQFMAKRDYRVHLPTAFAQPNEHLTAENPGTLSQRVRSLKLPLVGSLQIEIHSRLRKAATMERGVQLARDLSRFCIAWGSKPLM
jgi:hypothetical protein